MKANPDEVVASARAPKAASIRAEPKSQGFKITSGAPGRCISKNRAARAFWQCAAPISIPQPSALAALTQGVIH